MKLTTSSEQTRHLLQQQQQQEEELVALRTSSQSHAADLAEVRRDLQSCQEGTKLKIKNNQIQADKVARAQIQQQQNLLDQNIELNKQALAAAHSDVATLQQRLSQAFNDLGIAQQSATTARAEASDLRCSSSQARLDLDASKLDVVRYIGIAGTHQRKSEGQAVTIAELLKLDKESKATALQHKAVASAQTSASVKQVRKDMGEIVEQVREKCDALYDALAYMTESLNTKVTSAQMIKDLTKGGTNKTPLSNSFCPQAFIEGIAQWEKSTYRDTEALSRLTRVIEEATTRSRLDIPCLSIKNVPSAPAFIGQVLLSAAERLTG